MFPVSGGNHGGTPSGGNLTIEALESDISVAENTAIHIRVQSSGKKSLKKKNCSLQWLLSTSGIHLCERLKAGGLIHYHFSIH